MHLMYMIFLKDIVWFVAVLVYNRTDAYFAVLLRTHEGSVYVSI